MDVDIFKEILVPVVGGLGIFLLGLEFMDNGIQSLSVNKMRQWLAKMAGSPLKGLVAGTVITGIIQSSTAMTVMTVGLVNAGVLSLRSAISVVMGANIGTTLGNGLIALPLGPIGLLFAGIFACVYVFSKNDRLRNIALASMGFSLIFYGLNLMTGGLKPLRNMPEVMSVISGLDSSTFIGVVSCALIAALITAMIHSSSATIGIVMGLGASGVLEWQTAIAFAIGADLGTTITSWIASLNLSKNAKRTAYAHITFNVIGVIVVLILFFPAIQVLTWVMGFFGGDPATPVVIDGKETFPLVPVAVGLFSIFFNIFNVILLFPFVNRFEQVLSRIGADTDDEEDYSVAKYLDPKKADDFDAAVAAIRQENRRALQGAMRFLDVARDTKDAPKKPVEHFEAVDALSREIRAYTARLFELTLTSEQLDLVANLIEEVDYTASLAATLNQLGRRAQREQFSPAALVHIEETLSQVDHVVAPVLQEPDVSGAGATAVDGLDPRAQAPATPVDLVDLRARVRDSSSLPVIEKGALLAMIGSAERAEHLISRIRDEQIAVRIGLEKLAMTPQ